MRASDTRNMASPARRPTALRRIRLAAGLAPLCACVAHGPADVATSRAYQGIDRKALYERTVAALEASELKVTASDPANGMVTAVGSFDGRNWARCSQPRLFVEDSEDRHHLIAVPDRDRKVQVQALVGQDPQGVTLTLEPAFTAEPVSPMATTPECHTTGALEREIFEVVAKP